MTKVTKLLAGVKHINLGTEEPNRTIMGDFMERLLTEQSELNERLEKLQAFQATEKFLTLESVQQSLLNVQANAMATYSQVLAERISWLQK